MKNTKSKEVQASSPVAVQESPEESPVDELARLQKQLPRLRVAAADGRDTGAFASARQRISALQDRIEQDTLLAKGREEEAHEQREQRAAAERAAAAQRYAAEVATWSARFADLERLEAQQLATLDELDASMQRAQAHFLAAGGESIITTQLMHCRRTTAIRLMRRINDRLGSQVPPLLTTNEMLYKMGIRNSEDGTWRPLVEVVKAPPLPKAADAPTTLERSA